MNIWPNKGTCILYLQLGDKLNLSNWQLGGMWLICQKDYKTTELAPLLRHDEHVVIIEQIEENKVKNKFNPYLPINLVKLKYEFVSVRKLIEFKYKCELGMWGVQLFISKGEKLWRHRGINKILFHYENYYGGYCIQLSFPLHSYLSHLLSLFFYALFMPVYSHLLHVSLFQ